MSSDQRISFTLTLRQDANTPTGEIISWLKSLERRDCQQKIEQALMMVYLPYAKEKLQASQSDIQRSFWETQDLLSKHAFYQAQILKIRQANISPLYIDIDGQSPNSNNISEQTNNNIDKGSVENKDIYQQIDGIFGDD